VNHREDLPAGERDEIQFGQGRRRGGVPGALVDRRSQGFAQGGIALLDATEVAVPRPRSEVRIVLTALQVTFDRLFRRILHGAYREEGVGRERLTAKRV
jgi:hypothetical protein